MNWFCNHDCKNTWAGIYTHKKKLKKRMEVNRFDESSAPGLMSCKYFTNTFKILISIVKHLLRTVVEEQTKILFKRFLTLMRRRWFQKLKV